MEQQEKYVYHDKLKMTIALVLIIGVIGLGVLSILRDKIMENDNYQFSVSAEGKATAKPDIANLTFGVQTETKKTVAESVNDGNARMNKVVAELTALKIDKKDIMTTQYNLSPVYSYAKDSGRQVLDGYQLQQSVTVKVRDLNIIGEAIQKATAVGANQTSDVVFKIDDEDILKAEARAEAIKKAEEKAKVIAKTSGLKIGKLINVYENSYAQPMFANNFAYDTKAAAPEAAIPDIQSGQMEVKVDITLVYKVK